MVLNGIPSVNALLTKKWPESMNGLLSSSKQTIINLFAKNNDIASVIENINVLLDVCV